MRDLDFAPPWYRELIRRRRTTWTQVVALSVLAVVVLIGAVRRQAQVRAAERELAAADASLDHVRDDIHKLDALRQLRDQSRRQEQLLTSTGTNVEASRLLSALTRVVPPDVALTGVNVAVIEGDAAPATAPSTAAPATAPAEPQERGRRLSVALRGVAPGEPAVANVLAGISRTPLFRHVNLTYSKDRDDQDRTVREFEVTFLINLDPDAADERN